MQCQYIDPETRERCEREAFRNWTTCAEHREHGKLDTFHALNTGRDHNRTF